MRLSSPLLASAFAKTCHAELLGEDQYFHGVNEIHMVQPGDLTFVDHPKYYRSTLQSAASVILIDKVPEQGCPPGKALLLRANPYEAYDYLIREQRPPYSLRENIAASAHIHPAAIVEPGAIVGPKVSIGAYTRVEAGAVIYGPTRIGEHCRIGAGSIIGDLAFYFRGIGERGRPRWTSGGEVIIEDFVELGPLCNVAKCVSASTVIGRGTKIDAQCMIAHGVRIGKDCLFAAQVGIAGNCVIEDRVILYGQVGVAQNIHIGEGALVQAQTGVMKNIPAGEVWSGYPARTAREWLKANAFLMNSIKEG